MISDSSLFVSIISPPSVSVFTANGSQMSLASVGTIISSNLILLDVYYILQLTFNLISINQLFDFEFLVHFSSSNCIMQDPQSKKLIGMGQVIKREGYMC
ncbi:unnamed protein product [Ilex paraguariensis]|uniref:Retrovirus-related Pol polyprotein from transposon TNT 1-94-like beta-barrel domain-containing protein n=1 Tax=Ilex paraguariensis TaxID=185542 RepID=A0ABC8R5R8_9AQUA